MNKYYEIENKTTWTIHDTETDILIGTVTWDKEKEKFIAVPRGVIKSVKQFRILHCAIGYIGACTFRKSHNRIKEKQLNLEL